MRRFEIAGNGYGLGGISLDDANRRRQRLELFWIYGFYAGTGGHSDSMVRIERSTISGNEYGMRGSGGQCDGPLSDRRFDDLEERNRHASGTAQDLGSTITGNTKGVMAASMPFLLTFARLQASIVSDNGANCEGRVLSGGFN